MRKTIDEKYGWYDWNDVLSDKQNDKLMEMVRKLYVKKMKQGFHPDIISMAIYRTVSMGIYDGELDSNP